MKPLSSLSILLSISWAKHYRSTAFSPFRRKFSSQIIGASSAASHDEFCAEAIIKAPSSSYQDATYSIVETLALNPDISARKWMEDIEACNGSFYGVGAYTVLRCDASFTAGTMLTTDESNCDNDTHHNIEWNIWGLGFHIDRLFSSYVMLLESQNQCVLSANASTELHHAKRETKELIKLLLKEAHGYISMSEVYSSDTVKHKMLHRTVMLTVLWTPQKQESEQKTNHLAIRPTVRGHATFSGPFRSSFENEISSPISACLAIPDDKLSSNALESLPSRYSEDKIVGDQQSSIGATAKISSWCRKRKPLEDPEKFKVSQMNVGEVLLVNQSIEERTKSTETLELLEGLTSNLFVIYKDGTVRTAPQPKVLPGYSRHLVLKALDSIQTRDNNGEFKLVLDERAPIIQDAIAGLWSEVFVSSAIRLLIPVNRVLKPSLTQSDKRTSNQMTAIWQGDSFDQTVYIRNKQFQVGIDELSKYKPGNKIITSDLV